MIELTAKQIRSLSPLVVKRCKYCRCEMGSYLKGLWYCSEWCREMGSETRIIGCADCGGEVKLYYSKKGFVSNNAKYCDSCKLKRKEEIRLRKLADKVKKERSPKYNIDREGHTCKRCGLYKKIEEFNKNKNTAKGISYRCKICCKIEHRKYNQKNKEKIKEYRNKYNKKKIEEAIKALINKGEIGNV